MRYYFHTPTRAARIQPFRRLPDIWRVTYWVRAATAWRWRRSHTLVMRGRPQVVACALTWVLEHDHDAIPVRPPATPAR